MTARRARVELARFDLAKLVHFEVDAVAELVIVLGGDGTLLRAAENRLADAASPRSLAPATNLVRCAVKASGSAQYRLSSSSSAMTP